PDSWTGLIGFRSGHLSFKTFNQFWVRVIRVRQLGLGLVDSGSDQINWDKFSSLGQELTGVCNHAFHFHCISRWLKTRQIIVSGSSKSMVTKSFGLFYQLNPLTFPS
ncbi:hypothetical protein Gorai_020315, partial [Gossypium raimondii]|nr:hypothetical protein [Gossypium raimondii]